MQPLSSALAVVDATNVAISFWALGISDDMASFDDDDRTLSISTHRKCNMTNLISVFAKRAVDSGGFDVDEISKRSINAAFLGLWLGHIIINNVIIAVTVIAADFIVHIAAIIVGVTVQSHFWWARRYCDHVVITHQLWSILQWLQTVFQTREESSNYELYLDKLKLK